MKEENQEQGGHRNDGSCVSKVEILIRSGIELPTLGGRARILFGLDEFGGLYCLPEGGNGNPHAITREQIEAVRGRYFSLKAEESLDATDRPRHLSAGQYTLPNWNAPGATGMIVGPFLATLVKLLDQLENS